jgi:hypothetical protein
MTTHFFEFGATTTIDWTDVETVYVKASCLHDALNCMRSKTDSEDIDDGEKEFADFAYRTTVPEVCLLNNIRIFDAYEPPEVVVAFRRIDPVIDQYTFYSAEYNGRKIGTLFKLRDSEEWSIVCYDHFNAIGASKINWQYTGRADNYDEAMSRMVAFAQSIANGELQSSQT